eukprot:jgi/Astpho2/4781/fgenesh1_pg.00067_%23_227_t
MLHEEHEPERYMMLSSSLDGKFVTINSNSKTSSEVVHEFVAAFPSVSPKLCWEHLGTSGTALIEAAVVLWLLQVWLLRTDDPSGQPAIVQPRTPGLEYFVSHHAGQLLIVTNAGGAADYKLTAVPVPLTVAHRNGLVLDGTHPVLMKVYGAYGISLDTGFEVEGLPLLQRGWLLAFAHVRGGGELGRRQRGSLLAAVLRVPFVDLLSHVTDNGLPLTQHEHEEWGNPAESGVMEHLSSLCPYQQLSEQNFPPILVTCSTNDARVPFWGPLKWASKVRQMQKGCAPVLLLNHEDGGHFGHDTDALHTAAAEQAFLLTALSHSGKQSSV